MPWLSEQEPGGDAGAEAYHEPRRQLSALALEERLDAFAQAAERVSQNRRARCGRGAPAMLGALIYCIYRDKTKESA